ncbi:U32 family peptidase [Candidatus Peregrinibacteria bacterium]|nr:U32 family peptidase [Candidatus Peregrinibacteria bacterium]MBT4055834.1 U32 family peptidase [Candidatus Peregrinibacteria bacterium]
MTKNKTKNQGIAPELLVPAGDLDKLKFAFEYGADAVYMGLPSFSMRSRTNEFDEKSFMEGVDLVRKLGKKFYITENIFTRNNKVEAFKKHLAYVRDEVKPDAIILADPGILELVREVYPEACVHLSVQANCLNYKAVEFWQKQGVSRVILPRELMLQEIAEIHEKVPSMELEYFVHGAICMAYSGRCLISNYLTGRDSNQGICAQSCRWKYKMYLEEELRPGEFMPVEEDEHGTYIMNSKDNCQIEYLRDLQEAGVCSFKVEGRNKTVYYLGSVTKAYRRAIDDMVAGRDFDPSLREELDKIANRGYVPGFLKGFPGSSQINLESPASKADHYFVGVVREADVLGQDDLYRVEVRNRVEVGDEIEVVEPGCEEMFKKVKIEEMIGLDKESVDVAHGGAKDIYFRLGKGLKVGGLLRGRVVVA